VDGSVLVVFRQVRVDQPRAGFEHVANELHVTGADRLYQALDG